MRFYYKKKDGTGWFSLKTPDFEGNDDYIRITEKEWEDHIKELEAQE